MRLIRDFLWNNILHTITIEIDLASRYVIIFDAKKIKGIKKKYQIYNWISSYEEIGNKFSFICKWLLFNFTSKEKHFKYER
jgi:hypothetical protein